MPYVLIIHDVDAYPAWKTIFDDAAGMRKQAGEIRYQLLRHETDANRIVHFSEWVSLDNARRFFESPELSEIRRGSHGARISLSKPNRTGSAVTSEYELPRRRVLCPHFRPLLTLFIGLGYAGPSE